LLRNLVTLLFLLGSACPAAAALPSEPILSFRDLPVHTRGKPSPSQVREVIIAAGRQSATVGGSTWHIAETEPGQLVGRIQWSRHTAEVSIPYSVERFSVVYRGSDNLGYDAEGQVIHPTYNRLVRALVSRIQSNLWAVQGDPALVIPAQEPRAAVVHDAAPVAFSITADAGTKRSRAWPALVDEWLNHFPEAVENVGASPVAAREGEPAALGRPGTLVAVHVNSFRFLSPGRRYARSGAGQLNPPTGSLDVRVQYYDLMTGDALGSERAYTVSPQRGEDFHATTTLQVRNMAREIMLDWRESAAAQPRAVAPTPSGARQASDATVSSSDRGEVSFWESVRNSRDPAELQAYLDRYPNGVFAPLARSRLAALSAAPATPAR